MNITFEQIQLCMQCCLHMHVLCCSTCMSPLSLSRLGFDLHTFNVLLEVRLTRFTKVNKKLPTTQGNSSATYWRKYAAGLIYFEWKQRDWRFIYVFSPFFTFSALSQRIFTRHVPISFATPVCPSVHCSNPRPLEIFNETWQSAVLLTRGIICYFHDGCRSNDRQYLVSFLLCGTFHVR